MDISLINYRQENINQSLIHINQIIVENNLQSLIFMWPPFTIYLLRSPPTFHVFTFFKLTNSFGNAELEMNTKMVTLNINM